ncbi:MAG TPA: lysophospholipid acyltransferase family protein [Lichenihabitans sp.]|jgi:hypothetical protein|nr:lysophospholipid acyltransferase family protein [Lichenihabitans sp.]
MLKTLGRSRGVLETAGALASGYLRLVRTTNRFVQEPPGFIDAIGPELPVIVAMWHGQHFMIHYAWPPGARVAALISRHEDGEINAIILRHLGVEAVRGSGGKGAEKTRQHKGAAALRDLARKLDAGTTVVMTADIPKVSRRAGPGIVALARMTGRPIYPLAVVTSRRFDFPSWDRASLGKPFGRGAMVLGDPVRVDRQADAQACEAARLAVEIGLDRVHARAYALVGDEDPGRRPMSAARVPP